MTAANHGASDPALRVVPQQARGKEKLARVLDAADRIMATEGVEAITTVRVAAEAEVSVGSLYRYLPNREALLEVLARYYLDMLEELMDGFVEQARVAPFEDLVGTSIDAFADFYRSHPGFRALWFSRFLTEETRALDREHKSVMAHRIRDVFAAQGIGRQDKATLSVARTVQLTTDVMIQEAFRINPHGDKTLLEQLKVMVRSYLAASES